MRPIPRWIILSLFLFICLFLTWFVYDKISDQPSLRHVVAVLADVSNETSLTRQKKIHELYNSSILCKSRLASSSITQTYEEMGRLVVILDSSRFFFRKINSESENRWSSEKTFHEYQSYINRNIPILEKYSAEARKILFNQYLRLNEKLLPEETRIKEKNAVALSVIVLDESLTRHILSCMNKLSKNLDGCDDQSANISAGNSN